MPVSPGSSRPPVARAQKGECMTKSTRGDRNVRPLPIKIDHYSTEGIPDEQRHAVWATTAWPSVAALFDSTALDDFSTEADMVALDRIFLQYARSTAREFERTVDRAGADGIDVLGIGIQLDGGAMTGRTDDRTFTVPERAMLVLDTTRPCHIAHPSGASIQIALPRALRNRSSDRRRCTASSSSPQSAMHRPFARTAPALPTMAPADSPDAHRAICSRSHWAVRRSSNCPSREPDAGPRHRRARAEIELRNCRRSTPRPCASGSVFHGRHCSACLRMKARPKLEPSAGRRAHALAEPLRRRSTIAYRFGFSDSSHLTRLFKAKYGQTPPRSVPPTS